MEEPVEPVTPPPLSKVPSWILLGFVGGALTILMLPRLEPRPLVAPAPEQKSDSSPPLTVPRLTTIEAQFEEFGKYAVWDNDTTQVRLWNPEAKTYVDAYEVVRNGEKYFFRSIPRLTRVVLTRGIPPDLPLQFTESEASRKEFERSYFEETNRRFADGFKKEPRNQDPPPRGIEIPLAPGGGN